MSAGIVRALYFYGFLVCDVLPTLHSINCVLNQDKSQPHQKFTKHQFKHTMKILFSY